MRKTYQRPLAVIEEFMLTEAVASCSNAVFRVTEGCANNGDWVEALKESFGIFSTELGCTEVPTEGTEYEQGCFHGSTGGFVS